MDKKKKSIKKSAAPKIKDLDAKHRRLAIIKQKQCDSIALHIVNKLIDCAVEADVFLQSLKYLNQCHYQDIVEERAISKLCGYPICNNEIKNMPSKQFHISTKTNKVYDITDRKNYCSNFCYKAGIFIKEQMLTSPLWYRDKEEIPNFHLLPITETGTPGQEIDQGILKLELEQDTNFTSISKFTQDMVNEMPENICVQTEEKPKDALKEEDNIQETENSAVNQCFVNIYGLNLADILKENAKYFENENNKNKTKNFENTVVNKRSDIKINENLNTKSDISECKSVSFEYNTNDTENKQDNIENENKSKSSNSAENCRINSDTIIKIESKGILKKSKEINSQKKRVSFSTHSEKEVETIIDVENKKYSNKTYKKPEQTKIEKSKHYTNMNLIGIVQERSSIYNTSITNSKPNENNQNKVSNNPTNISQIKNPDLENMKQNKIEIIQFEKDSVQKFKQSEISNLKENNKNININNKSENLNDSKILAENPAPLSSNENHSANVKDKNKEKRQNRLKNSSLYKKTNRISKSIAIPKNSTVSNLKPKLSSCMKEWFTTETVLFIYGEEYVKKLVSKKSLELFLNKKKVLDLDENQQKKFDDICKNINLMEMAEQKFDESVTGKKRRPVPRFENLREQSEEMDLRVQAFYSGCFEVHEEDTDTDNESVKGDDEDNKSHIEKGTPAVLPLVDNKDLMGTRRRIFLTSIGRTITEICEILKESPNRLLTELKHLINTFQFTAKNIVFKTTEWHLVTILLIQILSIRDEELEKTLTRSEVCQYFCNLGNQFSLEEKFIEELLNKIQIQNLLEECLRNNCREQ